MSYQYIRIYIFDIFVSERMNLRGTKSSEILRITFQQELDGKNEKGTEVPSSNLGVALDYLLIHSRLPCVYAIK